MNYNGHQQLPFNQYEQVTVTNATEPPKAIEGSEYGYDAWKGFLIPPSIAQGTSHTTVGQAIIGDETRCPETDECTYETYEIDETEEAEETEELKEKNSINLVQSFGSEYMVTDECRVPDGGDYNRPLFILAHKLRSIEEELNARFLECNC